MHTSDGKAFKELVATTFDAFSKPVPMPATLALWWNVLEGFELAAVRSAFGRYVSTETKFPPTPGAIRELLAGANGDQRPGADEAWAIALASQDENGTVVWTTEIAEAFAACRTVLDLGDEVGARMAFKDAYGRLVGIARGQSKPATWMVSLGFDSGRREVALRKAESAGLLPAPQVATLLPPPAEEMTPTEAAAAREQLAKIKQMLADSVARQRGDSQAPSFDSVRTTALKEASDQRAREFLNDQR